VFTAGTTNKVFCVVYKANSSDEERIIFRVYGNNTDKIIDRKGELENWLRLTAVDCAAPLYATFQNGMVCGYLPGKSLTVESLRDKNIYPKICLAMAKIHQIKPDRPRKPSLFKQIEKFMDNFSERFPVINTFQNADLQRRFDVFAKKRALNLRSDYARLKRNIKNCENDITFCHNDLLVHNIVHDTTTGKVSFIDYEYADFNYQCFDIANHFNEYAGIDNVDYSLCPDVEEKRQWIKIYLRFYLSREPFDFEIEQTLRQIPIFEAASHFLWSVWALVQSQNSTIDFDYLGYRFHLSFSILYITQF
uniref:ethanolamine kinase n=1 Tax=Syphacia muris TaxID=451379 RepID=A0A0N5B0M2_9BILA